MKRLSCLFLAGTLLCGLLSACTRPVSNGELPANADTTAPAANANALTFAHAHGDPLRHGGRRFDTGGCCRA